MMGLILLVGIFQSWNVALSIFNLCLISAVMTMGANVQWGYAGLINFGLMGYAALGGLAAVLISVDPVQEAWRAGGFDILMCLWLIIVMIMAIRFILKNFDKSNFRTYGIAAIIIAGVIIIRVTAEPGIEAIEAINPAKTGFLGGFGLPIMFSWIVGAFFAGGLAFVVGKVALGLRADYLAIATLLISEIVIAIIKHEDWLSRGVKNVIGLDRPVPYEVNLQTTDWFINLVAKFNSSKLELIYNVADKQAALNQLVIEGSSVFVKLCYSGLFLIVVIALLIVTQKALYSPWGRMMRAIRDNEEAANAMGKNVVKQHLLISEIVIAIIKHEDWLSRGVKNVIGLDRPVPYEVNLQTKEWFINLVAKFNSGKLELISNMADKQTALNQLVIEGSSVFVKLCYSGLFLIVVIALLIVTQKALYSPWGRMMRAIRDNEEAANAMGKNVVKQHLLIFILGSAIVGIAGAMLVTQDGLFTPGSYRPMRYTFLIWVMVIVGGSGNNFGAILGGFAVWFLWIEAAPIALFLINLFTAGMSDAHALKVHLIESVPYFRYLMMGLGLLLIMRYRPKGILPEKIEIK